MRILSLTLSIAFAVYGFFPYHMATNIDTSKPNQLVVEQKECGCSCPDAGIIKGQLQIPQEIASKYHTLDTTQVNLDIKKFNEPYNFELGHAKLYIKGKVIGADTILCDQSSCELVPRFQVDSWALVDTVVTAWTFPVWAGLLFLANIFLFLPALAVTEIVIRLRKRK